MSLATCTSVTPDCPVSATIYSYRPSLAANIFFTAWFGALTIPNLLLGTYYKTYTYMLALTLACVTECLGYVGRIILNSNPWSTIGFQIQICCLILGPAFNSAAIYLTLKHMVIVFGAEYSAIKPQLYTYIFITGDLISLVLQAVGGALAATADPNDSEQSDLGTDIMLTGIIWQVVTLTIFGSCAVHYVWRRRRATRRGAALSLEAAATLNDRKFRLFLGAVIMAFAAVFLRCAYRIAELAEGWGSEIMQDEASYIALEGGLVAYATLVQTAVHPGFCFPMLGGRRTRPISKNDDSDESIKEGKGHDR